MFKIWARWHWRKFTEKKFARSSTEVIWMQHLIHLDTCRKVSTLLKILHATQTRLTQEWVKRHRKSSKVREWGKLNSSTINVSVRHLWLVVMLMNRKVTQAKYSSYSLEVCKISSNLNKSKKILRINISL